MSDIIKVEFRSHWSVPVGIITTEGLIRIVTGPEDALSVLGANWPSPSSASFKHARRVCIAALCGRQVPDDAREAFVDACAEAHLLLRSPASGN